MPINPVVRDMGEAMSIYVNQLASDCRRCGRDVVTLSLGEAYFDLSELDWSGLDITKSAHYSESQGLPELRHKLAQYYRVHYQADVDGQHEILISAGSKPIIFMAMLCALAPGDEVLIHEPSWLSYPEQARMIGVIPRFIPYDCQPREFVRYLTERTRMLILCNPNNPAGWTYGADDLLALYETCRSRGIYLLVDEAYSDFAASSDFRSAAAVAPNKDALIVVNSLSKNMGISGWRIGYAISSPRFISQLLKINQHILTCAPTILLMYCARNFDKILETTLPQVKQTVEKRARIAAELKRIGLSALGGGATFYFFVSIGNFPGTSLEFASLLLMKDNIAVVPGSAYGISTDRFVRISIGTESEDRISSALLAIKRATELNRLDRDELQALVSEFRLELANRDRREA